MRFILLISALLILAATTSNGALASDHKIGRYDRATFSIGGALTYAESELLPDSGGCRYESLIGRAESLAYLQSQGQLDTAARIATLANEGRLETVLMRVPAGGACGQAALVAYGVGGDRIELSFRTR